MELLLPLAGVGWPTASVILHFCDAKPFPILDTRALWSLGLRKPPAYSLPFWRACVEFTRGLAASAGCDLRTLDRALWQYSRERQRS